MRKLLFVLILICSISVSATNYYVKLTGNDTNTGLSDAQAWKTVNKVSGFAFASGDVISFKGGDIWVSTYPSGGIYGRLAPIVGNITINSYGTGQAEITGWNELPGWTTSGNWTESSTGIWRMALANVVNRLWINGVDSYRCETTSLTDLAKWKWDTGYLYLKSATNPATTFTSIKSGSEQDRVIELLNPGITLDNLKISSGNTCIFINNANNVTVKNCTIGDKVNYNGINVWCSNGTTVNNIVIRNNAFITGDVIRYLYAKDPHSTGDAIQLGDGCTNCKIYSNSFTGWSHSAVHFYTTNTAYQFSGNEVYSNYITAPTIDYARAFNIDSHSASSNNSIHDNTVFDVSIGNQLNSNGLKFYNNLIDGIRAVPYTTLVGYGISISGYISDATNMEIYNNTIKNCINVGILLNWYSGETYSKSYNNIHDNTLINNGTVSFNGLIGCQIYVKPSGSSINHNTFTRNHLSSTLSANTVYYGGVFMPVSDFNTATPLYNDAKSLNDAVTTSPIRQNLRYGGKILKHNGKILKF